MSSHLTAFELTNQLLYMNFPSLKRKIFRKDLKVRCAQGLKVRYVASVAL